MICYWRFVFAWTSFVGLTILYILRVNISVAIVAMVNSTISTSKNASSECIVLVNESFNSTISTGEFNWTPDEQTMILSSFYWGYTIMQLPSGLLLLFFKPKWIYGLSTLITSILTFLIPVAANHGVYPMVALRFLMGICEGPTFPALYTLCGFWILPRENSVVVSFIVAGCNIGTIVGEGLTGLLIDLYGWRWSFYIISTFGCVWFLVFAVIIYDRPDNHPFISDSERELLTKSMPSTSSGYKLINVKVPWRHVFTSGPYIAFIICSSASIFNFYLMINCLPLFIGKVLGFNISQNGAISSAPYIVNFIVSMIGGLLQDFMKSKNIISVTKLRKLFASLGLVSCSVIMFTIMSAGCNISLIIVLVCFSISMQGFSSTVVSVNLLDLAPNYAGPLTAVVNFFNSACGIIAPYVKEFFTRTGETKANWMNVFITNSVILFCGAIVFVLFGSGSLQPWAYDSDSYTTIVDDDESYDSESAIKYENSASKNDGKIQ